MGNLDGSGLSDAEKYAIALANQQGGLAPSPYNGPVAFVRADYTEFHPDTFKGFTVELSEEPGVVHGPFATEDEADTFAYSRVGKVYTMSSVDHYKADLRWAAKA